MRPGSRNDFTVAIICGLPLNADAVEALFDETYDRLGKHYGKQPGDANAYMNGRIGKHNEVLCYLAGMGKGSAASVASSLQVSYTGVELALVIFLGDVIISDSVISYDFGRQYPGGFQRKTGIENTLGGPHRAIRALLNGLRAENARSELRTQMQQYLHRLQQTGTKWHRPRLDDILFKASYAHKHSAPAHPATCSCFQSDLSDQICEEALATDCDNLNCDKSQQIRHRRLLDATESSIYIGPVASADTVMKSGQHRDEIARKEKVIGFEMEGAGMLDNISCIIIKGVCDYADSHKSKYWQAYAVAAGASAAKAFLEYWMPANWKGESRDRHLMVPFAGNPQFVDRQEEIQKIENLISMPNGPRKVAITGLGGIGKTQIALELAYRMREREPDLGIKNVQPAEVKECLKTYFSQTYNKWILIFDNADQMDMWTKGNPTAPPLKNIIPWGENGHILFTSRNHKLAVELASPNMFWKLLIQKDLLQDNLITSALLEQLAFLPVAISQAAAYINQNTISLANYMSLLAEQERGIIELLSEEFEDDGRLHRLVHLATRNWLRKRVTLDSWVERVAGQLDKVIPNENHENRQVWRDYLPHALYLNKHDDLLTKIGRCLESDGRYAEAERLLLNVLRIRERACGPEHPDSLASISDLCSVLVRQGKYQTAEAMHRQALEGHKVFGPEHPNTFASLSRLGLVLACQRKYEEAEAMCQRVLEGCKKVLGPEHRDTLTSISNIGLVLARQGRYEEAEAMYREALQIYRKVLGSEHPDTLTSLSNLGSVLDDQGKYEEAEAMHQQALQGYRKVLGSEHPNTLTSMHHLAFTLRQLGKLSEALTLIKKCADLRHKVLGSDHPHTVSSFNSQTSTTFFGHVLLEHTLHI
ncbi:uncharacterized protein BDW70DRAFT_168748 [Aspergillus foveolatus]|uniref:uncharacterized protein n=1 Tax=Aspergillus foveolatus TaxID=210207 RepID=UPI003CCCF55C